MFISCLNKVLTNGPRLSPVPEFCIGNLDHFLVYSLYKYTVPDTSAQVPCLYVFPELISQAPDFHNNLVTKYVNFTDFYIIQISRTRVCNR